MKLTKSTLKQLIQEEIHEAVAPAADTENEEFKSIALATASDGFSATQSVKHFCKYAKAAGVAHLCKAESMMGNHKKQRDNFFKYKEWYEKNKDIIKSMPQVTKKRSGGDIAKRKITGMHSKLGNVKLGAAGVGTAGDIVKGKGVGATFSGTFEENLRRIIKDVLLEQFQRMH
jgi:hypothetical protein